MSGGDSQVGLPSTMQSPREGRSARMRTAVANAQRCEA